ncbi:MAG TPA: hypothetical protein VMM17_06290 [Gemmatimonadaceae bacterium]|nr:hypothetical protein [Gemmatimonadaceae bacterium]
MSAKRIVAIAMIAAGTVVLALRGISYTRERESVAIGGLKLSAERKGFIPPVVGIIVLLAGVGLLLIPTRKG